MTSLLAVLSALLLSTLPGAPAPGDWPQYLGPDRTGVAAWPHATFEWPVGGPRVEWRVETGPGYGGVAVKDDEVFLFDREKDRRDVLRVFDLESGEELWSAGYVQKGRLNFDGSRTVPTVVGRHVYTASGFGPVACFDRETRALVWKVDLEEQLDGRQPMFGWCTHPVVVRDMVLVAPLNRETGLVALDRKTGAVRWRSEFLGYSHSVPALVDFGGREQLLFNTCPNTASGKDESSPATIWSIDPEDGATLWRHDLTLCRLPIPPPVVVDDERLFVTGGYRSGSVLLRAHRGEDTGVRFTEEFRSTRGAQVHAPIVHEGHIYALVNENWTERRRTRDEGGLVCFDLAGKELWRTGAEPYFGRGGLVLAADALLVQDGFKGDLVAVRATPEAYLELGRFSPFDVEDRDGQLWGPPAVSGTRILMRGKDEIACVQLAHGPL